MEIFQTFKKTKPSNFSKEIFQDFKKSKLFKSLRRHFKTSRIQNLQNSLRRYFKLSQTFTKNIFHMSRFLRLCLQCKEHLTSVQEAHEEECGWQDVFGQPCLFLPQRVWHLYTKQEKIRERDKMIAKILGELPMTTQPRRGEWPRASCVLCRKWLTTRCRTWR